MVESMELCPHPLLTIKQEPSSAIRAWLTHPDSLTEKLENTAGQAHLQVIQEKWRKPDWWERYVLEIVQPQVFCREILISAHHHPCWYGRTMIPYTTYEAGYDLFLRLQNESLGNIIFNNAHIKRPIFTFYGIDKRSIEYYWLYDRLNPFAEVAWLRCSVFLLYDKFPFYLTELLLPGITRYLDENSSLP